MITPVRTRFAPSPTGHLHIGGARTALFSYLWAKKNNGQFLLRIEDTDKTREQPESWHSLFYGLKWLGIDWTEGLSNPETKESEGEYGPYIQSQRTQIYQQYAQELLDRDAAYYCFCTPERLEKMRQEQQMQKLPPRYDRRCRTLPKEEALQRIVAGEKHVLRLAVPLTGDIVVNDLLRGDITFHCADIDDQVLMKTDGLPTYHLANVIDDHLMRISHVIRGEEWLPSTPKHLLLYRLFGWDAPTFIHLTVFLSKSGGKMSKRDGASSLFTFRDLGFLPQALVNGIALLGWNPKTTEEFFTLPQLIERFELTQLSTANPVFDIEKLQWLNQQYMKKMRPEEALYTLRMLVDSCTKEYSEGYAEYLTWFSDLSQDAQAHTWQQTCERATTFWEIVQLWQGIMQPKVVDPAQLVWKKSTPEKTRDILTQLITFCEQIPENEFSATLLEPRIRTWIVEKGFGNGDVLWPMRYALSGESKSPPPFELAETLGKTETVKRLGDAKTQL